MSILYSLKGKGREMETAQQLIDRLNALCVNCRAARRRGNAKSIAQYKTMIAETLSKLEALGYDALDCLAWVGE